MEDHSGYRFVRINTDILKVYVKHHFLINCLELFRNRHNIEN